MKYKSQRKKRECPYACVVSFSQVIGSEFLFHLKFPMTPVPPGIGGGGGGRGGGGYIGYQVTGMMEGFFWGRKILASIISDSLI